MTKKMDPAKKRVRIIYSLDPEVVKAIAERAAEENLSASRFVEIALATIIAAKEMPADRLSKYVLRLRIEADREVTKAQKEEALNALL
jgi:antitoxin component of RelBE/YafQ-DinJ toxin-antitoxin module